MLRKDYEKLLKWKNKTSRKPLLVLGVRQCGKTYLVKELFAEKYYKNNYIYICYIYNTNIFYNCKCNNIF